MLTSAEHASARRRAKDARNAYGRARRWCTRTGAQVRRWETAWGSVRWTVHVAGFHPITDCTLELAVAQLSSTVDRWCRGAAAKGPTGAKLDRLRGILGMPDR